MAHQPDSNYSDRSNAISRIIAVDLDHTLTYKAPTGLEITGPVPGAPEAIQRLREAGWYIIIHTARLSDYWIGVNGNDHDRQQESAEMEIRSALWRYQIPFDEIWTGQGKPPAAYYIDDRAIAFTGDWPEVVKQIQQPESHMTITDLRAFLTGIKATLEMAVPIDNPAVSEALIEEVIDMIGEMDEEGK